jgi:hypothetical protein
MRGGRDGIFWLSGCLVAGCLCPRLSLQYPSHQRYLRFEGPQYVCSEFTAISLVVFRSQQTIAIPSFLQALLLSHRFDPPRGS